MIRRVCKLCEVLFESFGKKLLTSVQIKSLTVSSFYFVSSTNFWVRSFQLVKSKIKFETLAKFLNETWKLFKFYHNDVTKPLNFSSEKTLASLLVVSWKYWIFSLSFPALEWAEKISFENFHLTWGLNQRWISS